MSTPKSIRKPSPILMILSIALGFVALLASIGGFSQVVDQVGYHHATGEIVSIDEKRNENAKYRTRMRCSPVVEFQVDGQAYIQGPDQYSVYGRDEACPHRPGDSVEVRYNPANPSEATASDSTFDWIMGVVGAAVAIWFGICVPLRMILRSRKPTPETETTASSDYTQR